MTEQISNGNVRTSLPPSTQVVPSSLETSIYCDGESPESTEPSMSTLKEKNIAPPSNVDHDSRNGAVGKLKLGATTSLPFMGDPVISPINGWNPSASSDFLPKNNFNVKFRHHDHGRAIYPYGQLEHPSRNGTSSMPHMCPGNSRENISIVSPSHYFEGRDIGCPYPTRSYALEVLHGTSPSGKIIHSSINLDQFGLPVWPSAAVMEQEAEIASLIKYLEPTVLELEQQLLLFNAISDITNELFKTSRLVRFGSTVNGFSLRGADVDFCLFVAKPNDENAEDEHNSSTIAESVLTRLGAALMSHSRFIQIKVLTRARVPIIKLKDSVTGISCDIGVNNSLALHNTRLLFLYGQYDSRVLSLARIIKWWARKRAMNDSYWGTLSSYCLVMMLVFYLQQGENPILPILTSNSLIDEFIEWRKTAQLPSSLPCESSISELLAQCSISSSEPSFKDFISSFYDADKNESGVVDTIVDGKYSVKYISDVLSLKKMLYHRVSHSKYPNVKSQAMGRNLYPLLTGFFRFYTQTFSFSTEIVSPRTGKALSKESKQWSIQVFPKFIYSRRITRQEIHFGFV